MEETMYILFVCTGNTCRSPMAAAFLRRLVEERALDWKVDSAGLMAMEGAPMTEHAAQALARRQVPAEGHAAKRLTRDMLREADLVLTMSRSHRQALVDVFPELAEKVHTLHAFAHEVPEDEAQDVVDPFGGGEEVYEACAEHLADLVHRAFARLMRDAAGGADAKGESGDGAVEQSD
ncbi:low molecular weight protein arginine phosphatase [Alicyclobacillus sendaiensis]|uniref:Low molecular weight protein arginine phosphatase n=2 Tax=Alicyclobacillus sendaiensis TaxID=192387 RepID=A0ABT6XUX7_ALISE|nr:low molecular weight protein arginine phosphatase [Alicyclobacillus sendaiensis]MDI9258817.1 low molecular weight protein arginine phosphatase [Alicyclobacillus sendaiensis PA2]